MPLHPNLILHMYFPSFVQSFITESPYSLSSTNLVQHSYLIMPWLVEDT